MIEIDVRQKLGDLDMDIQLQLPMQGITAIFGRSGAGKTSLINVLSGLATPNSGAISLGQHVLYNSQAGLICRRRNVVLAMSSKMQGCFLTIQWQVTCGMAVKQKMLSSSNQ